MCRDNLRGFFEQCFSLVLKQVFGFDGFSWLNIIAKACKPCSAAVSAMSLACGLSLCPWSQATRSAGSQTWRMVKQGAAEADTHALVSLLAPDGKLFSAMHSADSDGIIQFSFPLERLPTHTQLLLASQAGRCAAGVRRQGLRG